LRGLVAFGELIGEHADQPAGRASTDFAANAAQLMIDGGKRSIESARDLLVAQACRDELRNPALGRREFLQERSFTVESPRRPQDRAQHHAGDLVEAADILFELAQRQAGNSIRRRG